MNDVIRSSEKRYTCLQTVGPDLRGCGLVFGSWDALKKHERTHTQLTSNANGYGTVFACAGCGKYSTSLVGKQMDGLWYCSACPPQGAAALLDRAVDVMSALHRAIEPDLDHPEIPGIVPAAAMRTFVDALADIDRKRCHLRPSHETLPPRIAIMNDGRAMGGSDVCHTCAAHCTVINDLETALRGLYWDNVDYLTLNKLGGMQNHWMRAARMALGIDVDDVRPTQKAGK
jgi:hypothetical protein